MHLGPSLTPRLTTRGATLRSFTPIPLSRLHRLADDRSLQRRGARRDGVTHRWRGRGVERRSAADASVSSPDESDVPKPSSEVFPRIREGDPYRLLGLTTEASFEEIQDARNYYYETYRNHAPSREAIELAFDQVLKEHMEKRKKFGFRAANLGRKTGTLPDDAPRKTLLSRFRECFEPAVPLTTIVNDGVIYLLLSFWAAGTQYATADPTGPFVVAIGFCAWRLFDKRQKRNPDGPFFGGSPIWGALATTGLSFLLASFLAIAVIPIFPWPASFPSEALGACLAILVIGYVSIFVK